MTESEIVKLIDEVRKLETETHAIEFKNASGGFPADVWKSVSSFSHRPEGGVIIFGIAENRADKTFEVTGLSDIAIFQERLSLYCRDEMVNCLDPQILAIQFESKSILACVISHVPDENKPCYKKQLGLPNGACVRIGNVDKVTSFEQVKEFIRNSAPFKFDGTKVDDVISDDLSLEKIKIFLGKSAKRTSRPESVDIDRVGDLERVECNVGILGNFEGVISPTVAGFLIFSDQRPQSHRDFRRFIIRCVRYGGVSSASPIIDSIDIPGTLDEQIEGMHSFILKSMPLKAKIVGTKRVEEYTYPSEAIREIVSNAVIHRDYQITQTYTQVSVFSNRIEVTNPGTLPPGITIENIVGSQFSRNEIISAILKDMEYMEEYGRGIRFVISKMSEAGLLPPIFKNSSNRFKVILLGDQFKKLNHRQIEIWQQLQAEGVTLTSSECLGIIGGVSKSTISADLSGMVDLDLIARAGKGPETHYKSVF